MKKLYTLMLPVFCLLLVIAWQFDSIAPARQESVYSNDVIGRGAYLVNIMACNDCHTPFKMGPQGPEPDMSLMLSGHPGALALPPPPALDEQAWAWAGAFSNTAYAGPWGVSYAANLTPDASGLKGWTEDMFVKAMKTGWHMGVEQSRKIQPPMPWPAYSLATPEDLQAIYAYLQSVPAVRNIPPAFEPPAQ